MRALALTIASILAGIAFPSSALAGETIKPTGSARATLLPARPESKKPSIQTHAYQRFVPDPVGLAHKKARAGSTLAPLAPSASPVAETTVVDGLNEPGLAATDNSAANQGSPSDSTGAIGPDHYVEFVNSKVAVYSRGNLGLVSSADLDAFVGSPGASVFDPQIQWDQQAGRWFYVAVDDQGQGNFFLDLGWSKTSDPSNLTSAGWCRFGLASGRKLFDDYPKLGHDNNHIIIGSNVIRSELFFQTARIWALPKPANGSTSCPGSLSSFFFGSASSPLITADGDIAFTPVPANTTDSTTNGYVVAADYPQFVSTPSQIMAWHIGGPADSPTLTADGNINVSTYDVPANVPQPGTSNVLDSLDSRLTQAVARVDPDVGQEAVWTQHTINGAGGRSVVRWYELLPASVTARQQGSIQDASNFVFNGAISPANSGHDAVIDYNAGSSSLAAVVRAQSRQSAMTLGTMGRELTLATSADADRDFTCSPGPCRWGDYAAASPDPLNQTVVWGTTQLNGPFTSDPHWATRNFAITAASLGYARPKAASPLRLALVPAYNSCSQPNGTHGTPLTAASCNPAQETSDYLTVGTSDANGRQTNFVGSVVLKAIPGDPLTSEDEADVSLKADLTDVRRKTDLEDYGGELHMLLPARVTDRSNSFSPSDPAEQPATVTDTQLAVTVPCAPTADTTVGATCTVDTTADAVAPGFVTESKRSIWQLGQVQVYDGGADGTASTADNTLFAVLGAFAP